MHAIATRIKCMRRPRRDSSGAKRRILSVVELHKELNPVRGCPILVAVDSSTGQLFFTAAKGLCASRDRNASESVARMVYDSWPQLRPSA